MEFTLEQIKKFAEGERLSVCSISEDLMDEMLDWYDDKIKFIDGINDQLLKDNLWGRHFFAFENNGTRFFICTIGCFQQRLAQRNKMLPDEIIQPCWCYVMLVCDPKQEVDARSSMTGSLAFNIFKKMLDHANYNNDEVNDILDSHAEMKDDHETQWHVWSPSKEAGKITRYEDCVYYDINKAHASYLMKLFPRVSPQILSLLDQAKELKAQGKKDDAQRIKDIFNMTVGYLKTPKADAEGTYWWIVHQVTKQIKAFTNSIIGPESKIVYANTDGVVISRPAKRPAASDAIGAFDLEYEGPVWVYQQETSRKDDITGYWCIQFGNGEIKGLGLPTRMHKDMDLENGKVVTYRAKPVTDGVTIAGKKIQHMDYEHITTVEKEIING